MGNTVWRRYSLLYEAERKYAILYSCVLVNLFEGLGLALTSTTSYNVSTHIAQLVKCLYLNQEFTQKCKFCH